MQKKHIDLAIATGVKPKNCFLLSNGKVLTFADNKVFSLYSVKSGNIYVDDDNIEIEGSIIKERKLLSEEGIVVVIYSVNSLLLPFEIRAKLPLKLSKYGNAV